MTASLELWLMYITTTYNPVYTSLVTAVMWFGFMAVGLPAFVWLAINNWDIGEANVTGVTLAECISLNGYALAPLLPTYFVAGMFIGKGPGLKMMVTGASAWGAYFLRRNVWPVMRASPIVDSERLSSVMWLWLANHIVLSLVVTTIFLR